MITIDLSDTVVAVTGASGGIGAAIAARFTDAGAATVVHHRREPVPQVGPLSVAVSIDLATDDGPQRLIDAAVATFGRLDAVINCAGVQPVVDFASMTTPEWDEMIAVNLTAVHRVTQAFARHAAERGGGGAVVHVASIEGHQPAPGHSHYAVAKAGVLMHAKAAAIELGSIGVRVNTVSPGLVHRDGIEHAWPDGVARWRAAAPLGRLGAPSEIGDACVFLCSPLAAWVTGTDLVVDGGVSARPTW
ncbi:MAG TPA: SDR family oxidoreductase [Ilumatobacteraceae bacterium]|nr:SDR family oxidoreductase [Ilumatobacteraceae bacterium]